MVALGAGALVCLAAGLGLRRSSLLLAAFILLGAEQAVRLTSGPAQADEWTPLYAAALLLSAELAWWSIEPRVPAWAETALAPLRLVRVVGVCAAGAVLAALVLVAASSNLSGGVGLELAGVLAAVAALAVVAWVARTHVR